MNKQDLITLMDRMYPGFFQQENIRNLPEETVYDEMLLPLADFQPCIYDKSLDISISFGYYDGDIDKLKCFLLKISIILVMSIVRFN